ncbi:PREDICTED: translation initiation factor IF-2-like [Priapulus caudatus]|uniref:Translation initiation factor IF-2-like n=1 Tax=Priapulus caudatus TaxID=37621 RepID=A0ABM1F126_PRICU|nr:PREDICTED: translation initiation factor IF-2-like [Priapulus caudatus]
MPLVGECELSPPDDRGGTRLARAHLATAPQSCGQLPAGPLGNVHPGERYPSRFGRLSVGVPCRGPLTPAPASTSDADDGPRRWPLVALLRAAAGSGLARIVRSTGPPSTTCPPETERSERGGDPPWWRSRHPPTPAALRERPPRAPANDPAASADAPRLDDDTRGARPTTRGSDDDPAARTDDPAGRRPTTTAARTDDPRRLGARRPPRARR